MMIVPQSEDVCAILANTPGDNFFFHGGGRAGLGFVPGAENVVTIEDNGRVSVTSTADFGAGIAAQGSALAVGTNGAVRPDGTTSAGSHFDWDIQLGVSVKDIFSSGIRAAFSKGGGGLKFGATLRYVLETRTTTRTVHDFNCD